MGEARPGEGVTQRVSNRSCRGAAGGTEYEALRGSLRWHCRSGAGLRKVLQSEGSEWYSDDKAQGQTRRDFARHDVSVEVVGKDGALFHLSAAEEQTARQSRVEFRKVVSSIADHH